MKLFIAGHKGMVGSALVRRFFAGERPDVAIIGAAKVGGIHANNTYPAEFAYDNLAIATNCIDGAFRAGVKRVLFLGSTCIYPKHAPQPMPESCLLTGPLEPTNEPYAIAKIAGLKLCEYYRRQHGVVYHSAMPTNLYGPGDNYNLKNSHVLPALIRKFHEAKAAGRDEVIAWGTGAPKRELLHVDDLADACAFLLKQANPPDLINIGTGVDVTIRELTELVAETVGFFGRITWDSSKPDVTPRKLTDISRLSALGWRAKTGLRAAYASFLREAAEGTLRG
jgi:GDP-L-fucose synthase